jgi:23S rRNA pseudouridine1911/1915/1917 synthase
VAEPIQVVEVPLALVGQRIDRVVALVAGVSRSVASALVAEGQVTIDDVVVVRPSTRVAAGTRLSVVVDERDEAVTAEPDLPLSLVHVDEAVVVVDKPAGMVVHLGSGARQGTLVNGLLARFPELAMVGPGDRPGIVHRLDKGTSGLLMVARTIEARASLTVQLQQRTVEREYLTLVWGDVDSERGVVDAPLGRSPGNAIRRAVVASGRPARTHYEVVARYRSAHAEDSGGVAGVQAVTLLRCRLETGRTHQIRVHMQAIGHPVVGDPAYRGVQPGRELGLGSRRPFLHAALLGFEHPASGERLRFVSPLPADLRAALDRLTPQASGGV